MQIKIVTRDTTRGQRWFVRHGERTYLDTANDGFTSYDAAKLVAEQLAIDPASIEEAPTPPPTKPAKPVIVPLKSESQRMIEACTSRYQTPRAIALDPTTPDGFRDIAAVSGIHTAWAQKVRALEDKLEHTIDDDPYNFARIDELRKSLATAKLGQQYA